MYFFQQSARRRTGTVNTPSQIDENANAYLLLEVWKKVSKKFQKKAAQRTSDSPIMTAAGLASEIRAAIVEPHERQEFLGDNLDNYRNEFLNDIDLSTLNQILLIHPVPEGFVNKYGSNAALDSVAKKTWARWERWGDTYEEHVVPIPTDMKIIKTEMQPVVEALFEWAAADKDAIVDSMRAIFERHPRHPRPDEWVFKRHSPVLESYLTKSQISQLVPELRGLREVRLGEGFGEKYEEAEDKFLEKLKKFDHILKAQGIDPDDVAMDAYNDDCLDEKYTRDADQINKEVNPHRHISAKNLSKPTRTSGGSPRPSGKTGRTEDPQR